MDAGAGKPALRVLVDSGCSKSIFPLSEPMSQIQTTNPVSIQGVGGTLSSNTVGRHPLFGEGIVLHGYDGPMLLSMGELCRTHVAELLDSRVLRFTPRNGNGPVLTAELDNNNLFPIREAAEGRDSATAMAGLLQHDRSKDVWTLHEILGHPSESALCNGLRSGQYQALGLSQDDIRRADLKRCITCIYGKIRAGQTTSGYALREGATMGQHLHADIAFVKIGSKQQAYLVAIDGASRFVHAERIPTKEHAVVLAAISRLIMFHRLFQRQRGDREGPIYIHTDVDSTITSLGKSGKLSDLGTIHVHTAANVHERVAERGIQTLKDRMRTVLIGLGFMLPSDLLPELFEWCVLGQNQTAHSGLGGRAPMSCLTGEPVDGRHLQLPFGTIGISHDPDTTKSLGPRGSLCMVIGRQAHSRALTVLLLGAGSTMRKVQRDKVVPLPTPLPEDVSRMLADLARATAVEDSHLVSLETPGRSTPNSLGGEAASALVEGVLSSATRMAEEDTALNDGIAAGSRHAGPPTPTSVPPDTMDIVAPSSAVPNSASTPAALGGGPDPAHGGAGAASAATRADSTPGSEPAGALGAATVGANSPGSSSAGATGAAVVDADGTATVGHSYGLRPRGTRNHQASMAFAIGGETNNTAKRTCLRPSDGLSRGAEGVDKVLAEETAGFAQIPGMRRMELAEDAAELTETILGEGAALTKLTDEQKAATICEAKQLVTYGVFRSVDLAEVTAQDLKDAIMSVMLITQKVRPDGVKDKTKSRLVLKGFTDKRAPDDLNSPTIGQEVIMMALNMAATTNFDIDIFDVRAAFLEAPLDRPDLLVKIDAGLAQLMIQLQPELAPGLLCDGSLVVHLNKALYGLKEAPRRWYETLVERLLGLGYVRSRYDQCLFTLTTEEGTHVVLVHVDDLLSSGPRKLMDMLRAGLHSAFREVTENINPTKFNYLGLTAERDRKEGSIKLTQGKYIDKLLTDLKVSPSEKAATPCSEQLLESKNKTLLDKDQASRFISLVMLVMYIVRSRPDIQFAVAHLTTRTQAPTVVDWLKLIKVARYLNGTKDLALRITSSSLNLVGAADAAFGVHPGMKSHTGGLMWLGEQNAPIRVSSKKQTLVTRSSTEAELVALDSVAYSVVWARMVLADMGMAQAGPTAIQQDNQSTIALVKRGNPGKNSRSVDIKYFWVSEKMAEGTVSLEYVESEKMMADGLTKALGPGRFVEWRDRLLNGRTGT